MYARQALKDLTVCRAFSDHRNEAMSQPQNDGKGEFMELGARSSIALGSSGCVEERGRGGELFEESTLGSVRTIT